jgi:hypothetical protein
MALSAGAGTRSQPPQPDIAFDLKPYGFVVDRLSPANTTLDFASDDRIGLHIYQCRIQTACKTELLIINLEDRQILKRSSDFPYPIRFLAGGNFLYFRPRELDLFGPDLQLLKTYPHPSDPKLDFAARSELVHLSPDQHNISIPVDRESEILATDNLALHYKIQGQVRALGTNRWFIGWNYSVAEGLTEQVYSENAIKDLRHIVGESCSTMPTYLNSGLVLMENCNGPEEVRDNNYHVRYRIKEGVVGTAVLPAASGNRFVTELYVAKSLDWSGTEQYKNIVLHVFESDTGKEIFHIEEVPSRNEPTWLHYIALSPSGKRLAIIRNGILKIYNLSP